MPSCGSSAVADKEGEDDDTFDNEAPHDTEAVDDARDLDAISQQGDGNDGADGDFEDHAQDQAGSSDIEKLQGQGDDNDEVDGDPTADMEEEEGEEEDPNQTQGPDAGKPKPRSHRASFLVLLLSFYRFFHIS